MVAKKFDDQKPRMSLIPQRALMEVAKVMTMGAKKYDDHNWRKGMNWSRLSDAQLRHMAKFINGQNYDEESGLYELAHAAANCLMLLEYQLNNLGDDDRHGKD